MNLTVRFLGCELLHISLGDDTPAEPDFTEHDNTSGQYELGIGFSAGQPDDRGRPA